MQWCKGDWTWNRGNFIISYRQAEQHMGSVELVKANATAIAAKFGSTTGVLYRNISQTQLNIARHYGGCRVSGHDYVYDPTDDSLIRSDVLKFLKRMTKAKKTADVQTERKLNADSKAD